MSNGDVAAILGLVAFFLVIIVLQLNPTGFGRKPK
jgi:hypothetical protein